MSVRPPLRLWANTSPEVQVLSVGDENGPLHAPGWVMEQGHVYLLELCPRIPITDDMPDPDTCTLREWVAWIESQRTNLWQPYKP